MQIHNSLGVSSINSMLSTDQEESVEAGQDDYEPFRMNIFGTVYTSDADDLPTRNYTSKDIFDQLHALGPNSGLYQGIIMNAESIIDDKDRLVALREIQNHMSTSQYSSQTSGCCSAALDFGIAKSVVDETIEDLKGRL